MAPSSHGGRVRRFLARLRRDSKMTVITTTMIYEDGVLRPLEPLELPERQRVQATLEFASEEDMFWFPDESSSRQNLYDLLRETGPEYIAEAESGVGWLSRGEFESALHSYEQAHGMSSAEFYAKWRKGDLPDDIEFTTWAILYQYALNQNLVFERN